MHKIALPILAALVGTIIVLHPSNPNNVTLPSRDSGVFLYVGWRLLNGDIPYRDVWDHKPPLIYFVDALGIAATPNTLWGVWLLQSIFIFFTIYLIYRVLDQEFDTYAALAGAILLISGLLTVLEKGNVTEEYALVFQAMGLWWFTRAWKKDFPIWSSFWMGIWGGIAFNFKQTTIGLWITYGSLLCVIRILQRKLPVKDLVSLLAGWLIPSLVLVVYLGSQNALVDFWEQAYLYNFAYIGKHEGITRLIPLFIKGFAYLRNGWVLYLAILGWLAALLVAWIERRSLFSGMPALIPIALIDFPIEVLLLMVSGRSILHYYLTLLPVMAVLAGMLVYTIPLLLRSFPGMLDTRIQKWAPGFILIVVLLGQIGQVQSYSAGACSLSDNDLLPVIQYIKENSGPDDRVLLIGAESVVNFLTRRQAPTRYVYQYPLALLGRRPMFEEYFNQILQGRPLLIIDTRGRTHLTDKLYEPMQKRSQIVRDGVKHLGSNYQLVAEFGDWHVYKLAGQ